MEKVVKKERAPKKGEECNWDCEVWGYARLDVLCGVVMRHHFWTARVLCERI